MRLYKNVTTNGETIYPLKDLESIGEKVRKNTGASYFVSTRVGSVIQEKLETTDINVVKHCIDAIVNQVGNGNENKSVRHHPSLQLFCSLQTIRLLISFCDILQFI